MEILGDGENLKQKLCGFIVYIKFKKILKRLVGFLGDRKDVVKA